MVLASILRRAVNGHAAARPVLGLPDGSPADDILAAVCQAEAVSPGELAAMAMDGDRPWAPGAAAAFPAAGGRVRRPHRQLVVPDARQAAGSGFQSEPEVAVALAQAVAPEPVAAAAPAVPDQYEDPRRAAAVLAARSGPSEPASQAAAQAASQARASPSWRRPEDAVRWFPVRGQRSQALLVRVLAGPAEVQARRARAQPPRSPPPSQVRDASRPGPAESQELAVARARPPARAAARRQRQPSPRVPVRASQPAARPVLRS